jgi:hypothetical protein
MIPRILSEPDANIEFRCSFCFIFIYRHWIIYSHSPISLIGATSKSVDTLKVMKMATLVKNSSSTTARLDTCNRTEESTKFTTSLPGNDIYFPVIHKNSSHRDGAIYKNSILQDYWYDYDIDITDRNESK